MITSRRLLVALVLLLLTLLSGGLALSMPLGEGYDENTHLKYVAFLAIHRRLPDQTVDVVRAAQHPPAYHATLALIYSLLRDAGRDLPPDQSPEPLILPYERQVSLPVRSRVTDLYAFGARDSVPQAADEVVPQETILVGDYYLLRATGVLFLLVLASIVFRSLDKAFPDRRTLAALAASASLLVPLVPGIFSTIGNDQFAALFGAAGFSVVLVSTARDRGHAFAPLALSGLLFGVGFLSKLWVLGAFCSAVWLVTFHTVVPWSRRVRSILCLGSGPLLIAGWWLVHRTLTAGSPLGTALQISRWPGYLRPVSPDFPLGYLNEAAKVFPSYLGKLGFSELTPGDAWLAIAAAWPLLLIGSALAGLLVRGTGTRDRILIVSFLFGCLVQFAALFVFSHRYAGAHGRYFLALLLPATAALVAGLPSLTGRRSRGVLAAFTVLMALGGFLLLHTVVLPTYWTEHRWKRMPDVVGYVDFGTTNTERHLSVIGGTRIVQRSKHYRTSGGRGRAITRAGRPTVTVFENLDPTDFLLLSPRLLPIGSLNTMGLRSAVELRVGERWLAGPLSIYVGEQWTSLAVPRDAIQDTALTVEAHLAEGTLATVAELALRRLPLRFERVIDRDGELIAEFWSEAPERLPTLELSVQLSQHEGIPVPLTRSPGGLLSARLTPPALGTGTPTLLLHGPDAPVVDMKLQTEKTDAARTTLAPGSPGLLSIDAESVPLGSRVCRFPARWIPPGRSTVHLLYSIGYDVFCDFVLESHGIEIGRLDGHWRASLPERVTGDGRVFVARGTGARFLDRVQIRQSSTWAIELEAPWR